MDTTYIMSNGMGVESVAILLRWIHEPETAPCALQDLIVITSQVGNEYSDTLAMHEQYMLPLFRKHGIRYVQVARKGHLEEEGIVVLEDSRNPTRMYGEGHYKLSDELLLAGSVPQFGSEHKCSLKFKAYVIESWIADNVKAPIVYHGFGYNSEEMSRVESANEGIFERNDKALNSKVKAMMKLHKIKGTGKHAIAFGYNLDEVDRYTKAAVFDCPTRLGFYPLVQWGWTREKCLEYIHQILGVKWLKSACVYCPFAHNKQSLDDLIERHKRHPEAVADAMLLEHVALSLNPRQTMYASGSLIQLQVASNNYVAIEAYNKKLEETPWAIYRVRRIYNAGTDKKTGETDAEKKGHASRCVEKTAHLGEREELNAMLTNTAQENGFTQERQWDIDYTYLEQKGESYPAREDLLVVAPAFPESKARFGIPKFNQTWEAFEQAQEVQ